MIAREPKPHTRATYLGYRFVLPLRSIVRLFDRPENGAALKTRRNLGLRPSSDQRGHL